MVTIGHSHGRRFCELCRKAFAVLRRHGALLVTLMELMLPAGVEELSSAEDIDYLREALLLHMDNEESEETFVKWIFESLHCKYTQLNHAIHTWVHN